MKYILIILFSLLCFLSGQLSAQKTMPTLPKDNSEQEGKRYEREKEQWIKSNPAAYEELVNNNKEEDASSTNWIFSDAEVLEGEKIKNIPSSKQQQAIHDFSSQDITIQVVDKKYIYLYSNNGNTKIFDGELRSGAIVENHENCPKCGSTDFDFEEFSHEHIVIKQLHESKDSTSFIIKYHFIKK